MSGDQIPIVDWRFGDRYFITEFVRPNTFEVELMAERLRARSAEERVLNVARWIRDDFYYPLDWRGQPSADGQLLKSRRAIGSYHFKKCVNYMWLFPSETIMMGFGICIDTSLVATSVLLRLGVDSVVALGAVYDQKGSLLGYHAWTEFTINNTRYVLETTIHEREVNNVMLAEDAYSGKYGIRYDKYAEFNHIKYVEYKPLTPFINFYGRRRKEIVKRELLKQRYIWNTYREISPLIAKVIRK